jgi:hypothetical protein
MTYEPVQDELKSHEDKDLAKSIWNFFLFQYDVARREEINTRHEYECAVSANRNAREDYTREADPGFGMWEPPYSEFCIENKKREMEQSAKNFDDAKALMNFIRDRFVDKFIP